MHLRRLVVLPLGLAYAARAESQTCTATNEAATRAHIIVVQQALAADPDNPMHLFRLAVDYVGVCDDSSAFDALERMAKTYGGLDPSLYRGFARIQGTPQFRQIISRIRAANPPTGSIDIAFSFNRPDLFPEGMAYDSATKRVYAGSTTGRNIVWTDSTAVLHDFVSNGQDGLGTVLGLHIDDVRHQLWAVSTGATGPGSAQVVRGLFQYDLRTGRLVARYAIPDTTSDVTFNDVVVVPASGVAYTTRSATGNLYFAAPGSSALREYTPPNSVPQANGLTLSPHADALLVAGGLGIFRIDLGTRVVTPLGKARGVIDATIDGLYRYGQSLIAIQNGVHPGRVMRYDLDSAGMRITKATVLMAYGSLLDSPTTGAVSGDTFYFMANPQTRRRNAGLPVDPATLSPVRVLRVLLGR